MNRLNYYAKHKVNNKPQIVCAWDTETDGLGGPILCCTYSTPAGSGIYKGSDSAIKWLDEIFFKFPSPAVHYAHFAEYDWRYILPELLARKLDVRIHLRTENTIYRIEVVESSRKKFIMHDSYALYDFPLREFASSFSKKQKGFIDFEKERFNPDNQDHIQYAIDDSEVLRECIINYNTAVEKLFGVSLGHTIAGTAMKAWQQTLDERTYINYSEWGENERFIREAYYGGIVFLTSIDRHKNCRTTDINSSYPFIMETYPMPYGRPIKVDRYVPNKLGIYEVTITTPPNLKVPIIPSRNDKGAMRWCQGTFKTHITNIELEFALLNGYILEEIHSGLIWNRTIKPFDEFVSKVKSIRKAHPGTSYEFVAKKMQNGAAGKFGSKRERTKIVFSQNDIPEDTEFDIVLDEGGIQIYSYAEFNDDMPCLPEWIVFITAYARMRLVSTAYKVGVEHVLYGDTDSLTFTESADLSLVDIGDEYGQFKLEKEWECFRAIAPKTYAGKIAVGKNKGKWVGAGKGLPKKKMEQRYYRALYEDDAQIEIEYETLPSLTVALRKGIKPSEMASRKSSSLKNSMNYTITNEGELELKYA